MSFLRSGRLRLVVLLCTTLAALAALPAAAKVPGPDGQIVFERFISDQPDFPGTLGSVFTANPDGAQAQEVPLPYQPEVFSRTIWSPDGSKLLVSHVVRLDSSGNFLPFRPAIVSPSGSGFRLLQMTYAPFDMDCTAWSVDQERILCAFGGQQPGVFSVRASDGGDPVRLTTNPFGTSDQQAQDLPTDTSPDGRWFVFFRFKPGPTDQAKHSALFVERLDGTGLRQITPYGVTHAHDVPGAQWSPDGRKIISATTGGGLFTVDPDGSGLRVIHLQTPNSNYFAYEPGWSPDGTEIVFAMFIDGTEGIFTANADGSNVVQVTNSPTSPDSAPDWGTHPLTG
jgi:Tol biopolymer transport system component